MSRGPNHPFRPLDDEEAAYDDDPRRGGSSLPLYHPQRPPYPPDMPPGAGRHDDLGRPTPPPSGPYSPHPQQMRQVHPPIRPPPNPSPGHESPFQPPVDNPPESSPWMPASQHLQAPGQGRPIPFHHSASNTPDIVSDDPFDDNAGHSYPNAAMGSNPVYGNEDVPLLPPGGFAGGLNPDLVGAEGAGMDNVPTNIRYGRIPQRQPRRYKTVKRVELYHGNLVLDCAVPAKLLEMCPNKEDREMTHMRYTAATCDPDDFKNDRFTLRQELYQPHRQTELFLVLTMYNEDEVLLTRTLHGVMKNIAHLCSRSRSKTWGPDGWKKAVVCIVSDGRLKANSRSLSVLAAMGVYQEGVAKNVVNGRPVTAHIYEYTTQISITSDLNSQGAEKGMVPVQILFCLKEKNQKKINSHRWFFNAFAPILQPNVCVLLDVGTQPGPKSIYHLWKSFDVNSNVGGACGEIVALKGKFLRNLVNPLVATQNFEYKMSNILDKPTESVFGYISVLPGAFSAYRYVALLNDDAGHGPLQQYFKGETLHHSPDADLWTKNMYLAEDRILCWELVAKRQSKWVLHYSKSAYAITDVPDAVPELISQRRRWLNGSFFAGVHSIVKFGYIYRSDHGFLRKLAFHFLLLYNVFNLFFSWFSLANFYIAFTILTRSLADPSFDMEWIKYLSETIRYIYLALLVMCFLLAMGNRPQGSKKMFTFAMFGFAVATVYMIFSAIFITVKGIQNIADSENGITFSTVFQNGIFLTILLSLMATYGLYLIASFLFFEPWHMFTSFLQYLLMAPSMINVINVYAFCNIHDVSWGTKGDTGVHTDLGEVKTTDGKVDVAVPSDEKDIDEAYGDAWEVLHTKPPKERKIVDEETRLQDSYKNIRTNVVLAWALTNGALVVGILSTSAGSNIGTEGSSSRVNGYMAFILYSVTALATIRFIGCVSYLFMWVFQG